MAISIDPAVFGALADATRRALFERLAAAPTTVGELAAAVPVTRSAVSQHLKILKQAGLVCETRAGKFVTYRVEYGALEALERYVQSLRGSAAPSLVNAPSHNELQQELSALAALWPGIDPVFTALLTWIRAIQRQFDKVLTRSAANSGVGLVDIFILGLLHRIGAPHQSSPTHLSKISIQSLPGITRRLDRLERLGLVTRAANRDDRRGKVVQLSDKGSTLLQKVVRNQFAEVGPSVAALADAEQRELARLLRKLLASLQTSLK